MAERSAIEWTDATWSPIRARRGETVGWHCEHVSPGCVNCYAEGINRRLGTGADFKPGLLHAVPAVKPFLDEKLLLDPLRWRKPRMIFVCSMTDLFADFVNDHWIDKVFAVMALAWQHTYQVLTKRPKRMREYFARRQSGDPWAEAADEIADLRGKRYHPFVLEPKHNPLPNVWLGISAEDQKRADERVDDLLATPAAIRFVSYEPALGPVDFSDIRWPAGRPTFPQTDDISDARDALRMVDGSRLDWIIAGGESGPGARPAHPDWFRSVRDQCAAAGVPFFFKQWGEYGPCELGPPGAAKLSVVTTAGAHLARKLLSQPEDRNAEIVARFGKRRAGRLLDGVEHNALPERR